MTRGLAPPIDFEMASGYINVTSEDFLFYWYMGAAPTAPSEAPVLFWSNGGPGCSAMEGATTEGSPICAPPSPLRLLTRAHWFLACLLLTHGRHWLAPSPPQGSSMPSSRARPAFQARSVATPMGGTRRRTWSSSTSPAMSATRRARATRCARPRRRASIWYSSSLGGEQPSLSTPTARSSSRPSRMGGTTCPRGRRRCSTTMPHRASHVTASRLSPP